MAKLSIIVPVYNTNSEYLSQCLKSIYSSSYKDIEVVLVDDGSSVDYSDILKEFSVHYVRTKNFGTLKARMTGIESATGQYICFVDSDDTVSFDYFESLVRAQEKSSADLCVGDWAFESDKSKYFCKNDSLICNDLNINGEDMLNLFFSKAGTEHSYYVLWNKLYKKEILTKVCADIEEQIERGNIQERVCYAEDVMMTYFYYKRCCSVVNVHIGYYFYRIHSEQETANSVSIDKLKNQVLSMTQVFQVISEDLKTIGKYALYEDKIIEWKNLICGTQVSLSKLTTDKEIKQYIMESYGLDKYKKIKSKVYAKQVVLPQNLEEVDDLIFKIMSTKEPTVYAKRNGYAYNELTEISKLFDKKIIFTHRRNAEFLIKENYLLISILLHSYLLYNISCVLFPKGSKLRRLLKSKL